MLIEEPLKKKPKNGSLKIYGTLKCRKVGVFSVP